MSLLSSQPPSLILSFDLTGLFFRCVRYQLKQKYNVESGITMLLSLEKQVANLVPAGKQFSECNTDHYNTGTIKDNNSDNSSDPNNNNNENTSNNQSDFQLVPHFRVGIIPVLGPIPAIFGCAAASYVLTRLARQQQTCFTPNPIFRINVRPVSHIHISIHFMHCSLLRAQIVAKVIIFAEGSSNDIGRIMIMIMTINIIID